ncbi:MAG: phosphoribosyltransferase family protein [Cyclobacteriaceae bacterium]
MRDLIYSADKVKNTILRMAFEIYEHNLEEKEIVIAGIKNQGYELARLLKTELEQISSLKISLIGVKMDKRQPYASDIVLEDIENESLDDKVVIVVDDVLNSGRTFAYCLKALLQYKFRKIELAVLVNRSHKQFPVSAKYKGYDLSTTISDYVEVQITDKVDIQLHD